MWNLYTPVHKHPKRGLLKFKIIWCSRWFCNPPFFFVLGCLMLYLRLPKGCCFSISDDLYCSFKESTDEGTSFGCVTERDVSVYIGHVYFIPSLLLLTLSKFHHHILRLTTYVTVFCCLQDQMSIVYVGLACNVISLLLLIPSCGIFLSFR